MSDELWSFIHKARTTRFRAQTIESSPSAARLAKRLAPLLDTVDEAELKALAGNEVFMRLFHKELDRLGENQLIAFVQIARKL